RITMLPLDSQRTPAAAPSTPKTKTTIRKSLSGRPVVGASGVIAAPVRRTSRWRGQGRQFFRPPRLLRRPPLPFVAACPAQVLRLAGRFLAGLRRNLIPPPADVLPAAALRGAAGRIDGLPHQSRP